MEKGGFSGNPTGFNWQSDSHNTPLQAAAAAVEMKNNHSNDNGNGNGNGVDDQSQSSSIMQAATSCFLNLNWDQSSTDQTANFESALSSLVSSASSCNPNPNFPSSDRIVIGELIGRPGSICNNNYSSSGGGAAGDDMSPPNSNYQSTNTSCYSTPLNSPPKLNLSMLDHHRPQFQLPRTGGGAIGNHPIPFDTDPGFAERAARFSCFGAARLSNYPQFGPPLSALQEPGKLSRVSSSQSLKTMKVNGTQPQMGMNVKGKDTPMHLRLQQQQDGIGIGIGTGGVGSGQLETEDMMLMMMRLSSSAGEFGNNINNTNAQEESSASDRMAASGSEGNGNVRKRKITTASSNKGSTRPRKEAAAPAKTPKVAEEDNSSSKRSKSTGGAETNGNDAATVTVQPPKVEQKSISDNSTESAQKQGKDKDNDAKPPEPPKQDYIHVRARRGQATDSHSLAERAHTFYLSNRLNKQLTNYAYELKIDWAETILDISSGVIGAVMEGNVFGPIVGKRESRSSCST